MLSEEERGEAGRDPWACAAIGDEPSPSHRPTPPDFVHDRHDVRHSSRPPPRRPIGCPRSVGTRPGKPRPSPATGLPSPVHAQAASATAGPGLLDLALPDLGPLGSSPHRGQARYSGPMASRRLSSVLEMEVPLAHTTILCPPSTSSRCQRQHSASCSCSSSCATTGGASSTSTSPSSRALPGPLSRSGKPSRRTRRPRT
jgi:hypothetical protein